MNLVDAEIKDTVELITRLVQGEVFYYDNKKIYFEVQHSPASPFRVGDDALYGYWGKFKDFQKETKWYHDLASPVLCYVADIPFERKKYLRKTEYIYAYAKGSSYPFKSVFGHTYVLAEPVAPDELKLTK